MYLIDWSFLEFSQELRVWTIIVGKSDYVKFHRFAHNFLKGTDKDGGGEFLDIYYILHGMLLFFEKISKTTMFYRTSQQLGNSVYERKIVR